MIEHIGDLCVVGKALAGRGGNNIAAGGVGLDNIGDLLEMSGVCQGTTAELNYLQLHGFGSFLCSDLI